MENRKPLTIICLTCYHKGHAFIKQAKEEGCKVYLLTDIRLKHKDWPWESIDEAFYLNLDSNYNWDWEQVKSGMNFLMKRERIDRVVALDDFDVEKAAIIREEFRIAGMGHSTSRFFRDKLAMRYKAESLGIMAPAFVPAFNDAHLQEFMDTHQGPWLLKPRGSAASTGIKKINESSELWPLLENIRDGQGAYLLECFRPGEVYHVDSIVFESKVVFSRVHKYLNPPLEVTTEGRVFRSINIEFGSADEIELTQLNAQLLEGFGMRAGVSHTEFIKSAEDGKFYFLETSARVGGAHLMDALEASSGLNLWREWARVECLREGEKYKLPKTRKEYAGIIISLARQKHPDLSAYAEKEIVWRMDKEYHVGLVFRSRSYKKVMELLEKYATKFYEDFFASGPQLERPTD
jgi:hypothetical protein